MSSLSTEAATIRLLNRSQNNLSFTLHKYRPHTQGALRRGIALWPVHIKQGEAFDVCRMLDIDYAEAERVIAESPQVRDFERKGYLQRLTGAIPAAPSAPIDIGRDAMYPAHELEPAWSFFAKPALEETETAPPTAAPAPLPLVSAPTPVAVAVASADAFDLPPPPDSDWDPPPGKDLFHAPQSPSMDWEEARLREYATVRNIDVTNAKSKSAILKAIRGK